MAKTGRKKTEEKEEDWFIERDARQTLFEMFKEMKEKVVLEVFTKKGENDPYNDVTVKFTRDLAKLSSKIQVNLNSVADAKSKKYDVASSPTVLINPEQYRIRYTGAPAGEEGRSFIETIMLVSRRQSGLSKASKEILSKLSEKRNVQVFVTLACPYCPGQVLNAFRAAIEKPDLVSGECVDSNENVDLAKKYNVGSVPHTVINGKTMGLGFEPEERFISELVTLEPVEEWAPSVDEEMVEADVVIVGAGPAGLTAGIYAERSGLNAVVLEKETIGGQVLVTPSVENYPGFDNIAGKKLMEMISAHAQNYVNVREGEEVREIKIGKNIEAITNRARYVAKALILATGARYRKLKARGEDRFFGHGVSYCAMCDGNLYKGRDVIVVGGGNTALTDALYLKSLRANVRIVHRRDQFRAEKYLQESVKKENIPVIWDSAVEEILGKDKLDGVKLKNTKDNTTQEAKTDGLFVSIGEVPNIQLATEVGIELSDSGFIKVDRKGKTNIPRIYAAGDVTGAVRQIVTAVGEGAAAAMSAFEGISSPYWTRKAND
ncbi:FAD-binding protein [candidate division TA06 bacterium]|uniref:FAD-binding protein n=1 Tax=candidate division TA06 bacterium TaxID=2250710 RepID=A0A523UU10_UNCT6|nr:MAG: FAD-binding protein [candidate division TA06 bacterium]